MSLFSSIRKGSWWLHSKSDPRWNANGTTMVGGFMKPEEVDKSIERTKKKLKTDVIPEDLEWGYMKD